MDRDLPKIDRARVLKHFSSQYSFAMYDENKLLQELPPYLSADIAFRLYGRLLRPIPFFEQLDRASLTGVCKILQHMTYGKNGVIFQQGHHVSNSSDPTDH